MQTLEAAAESRHHTGHWAERSGRYRLSDPRPPSVLRPRAARAVPLSASRPVDASRPGPRRPPSLRLGPAQGAGHGSGRGKGQSVPAGPLVQCTQVGGASVLREVTQQGDAAPGRRERVGQWTSGYRAVDATYKRPTDKLNKVDSCKVDVELRGWTIPLDAFMTRQWCLLCMNRFGGLRPDRSSGSVGSVAPAETNLVLQGLVANSLYHFFYKAYYILTHLLLL